MGWVVNTASQPLYPQKVISVSGPINCINIPLHSVMYVFICSTFQILSITNIALCSYMNLSKYCKHLLAMALKKNQNICSKFLEFYGYCSTGLFLGVLPNVLQERCLSEMSKQTYYSI